MPEGDTLYRTAASLRPHLVGRRVVAATARQPGPRADLLVGTTILAVDSTGRTSSSGSIPGSSSAPHLRMHGAWHRYRPGERWRRPAARARIVIEVPGAVAVCFDAPVVELLETRAEPLHAPIALLGPDLLAPDFDEGEALRRLRAPERAPMTIAEALLDQRALAGIGNVYCDETLFAERVHPFIAVRDLPDERLVALVRCAGRLLDANRLAVHARPHPRQRRGRGGVSGLTAVRGVRARAAARSSSRAATATHRAGARGAPGASRRPDRRARAGPGPRRRPPWSPDRRPRTRIIGVRCASSSSPGPSPRSRSRTCGASPSASSDSAWPGSGGAPPG